MSSSGLVSAINRMVPSTRARRQSFFIVVFGLCLIGCRGLNAPAKAQTSPAVERISSSNSAEDTRYRIGPGDVLAVVVRKAPELSLEAVRVDQRGMINIPMIDDPVFAACKTESELSVEIAKLYLDYKKNPGVAVFVREFQSRPVAVIGAVNTPGQFRLQRQVRLLELLSSASGPSDKAGRVIDIIHAGGPSLCRPDGGDTVGETKVQGLVRLELNDTMKGKEGSNPFIEPGDIVSVPEADQIFVIGHVVAPRAIALKDKPITVSRAIAMAGGLQTDGRSSHIRIIRQTGESSAKEELLVNLSAIEKRQAPDVVLLPNDIVAVPSSTGKTILNTLTGAIAPAIANTTLRVIP